MNAWERFGRWRLATTRWQSAPEALCDSDSREFEEAWARQRRLELAITHEAQGQPIPEAVLTQTRSALSHLLREGRFSAPDCHAIIRHHALMEIRFARIAEQAPPPDDMTVLAWYQRHQAQFMRPEQRLTWHLLLTVEDNRDAMYRQARLFYRQSVASRQSFSRLAQRYSHCPSALEGGRLGWISRGLLYPELDAALFTLEENGLAPPVETTLGWHLLWCESIRPPAPMPQTDALVKAREYLWRESRKKWQRRWLAMLLASQNAV